MSAKRAKSTATPYRGNQIRLLNGKGKLIRVYTIEEFLRERPVKAQQSVAAVHRRRGKNSNFNNSDVFRAKAAPDTERRPDTVLETDYSDIFEEARTTRRADRSARED